MTTASASPIGRSILIEQFREFFALLARLKDEARSQSSGTAFSQEIWPELVTLFERQQRETERWGKSHARAYEEALYAMVGLADETFIHLEWIGRESWKSKLLESRFFQSHVAGERLFERIDRVLHDRDPTEKDLAAVYLCVLALGFHGRYRGESDLGELASYRRRLYQFVAGRDPSLGAPGRRLFPELPLAAVEQAGVRKLPDARRWYVAVALVALAFVAVAHVFWRLETAELRAALDLVLGRR